MVENAPSSVDLQDFQFKLHSKLKVFENNDDSKFKNTCNLVAAASRFGLVFVGTPNSLEVIQLKSIENSSVTKLENSSFPKRSIPLPAPTHLTINCDQTLLAVICYKGGCATAVIYCITSFLSQNIAVSREIRVSVTPGVFVLEAGWNPTVPGVLTACKADGSLGVYNLTETGVEINELPVAAAARCFCWSPKGKQLVVGSTNGSLTQYKPDLKAVKVIPAPALGGAGPHCAISVCWVSNYQFMGVFRSLGDEEARPSIVLINAPKAGPTTYINYEDICYSYGTLRSPQYYIIHQPTWGVMLVASANSMEVGVLGVGSPGEPALWQQWNQIDAGRAELPLSAAHQETFPVGVALDTGVTSQLPWGENQTLPPMPLIHLLSHHGVLCSFSVINIRAGAANVCTQPEPVADMSGLAMFQQAAPPPAPAPVVQPVAPQPQQPPPVQVKPQQIQPAPVAASTAPSFGVPASGAPPTFGSLGGVLGGAPQPAFGSPASIASSTPAPPTSSVAPVAAPPGSLLGWTAGSTLFGQGTSPSFGNIAPSAPAATMFNITPTTMPVENMARGTLTTTAPGSSSFLGGIPTSSTPNITSSMFRGVSAAPSTPAVSKPLASTPLFGLGSNTPTPNFGAINMTTPKPATPNVASVTPVASVPANVTAPTQQQMPIISTPPVSKPLLSTPKQTPKPDILNTSQSQNQMLTPAANNETVTSKKDESAINDQIMQGLIKEEVKNFHAELQELFLRCKTIKLDVGTEEEKTNLVLTTESLLEFHKELQDTTDSQVAEVHYLKQALMQSFAWYEDTKARHRRYTDPNFSNLLQAQELDPISEKQLADIKHLIYYIEAQLKQVDSFLDNQWADFQDSCKKQVKGRLQIPTLEPIYQSLVRQNAILDRHRYLLKDISARIKSRNKKVSAYPNIMNLTNLTSNKDPIEIDEELRKLKLDHGDLFAARYDKILTQENKFTDNKQSKLCSFFTNRNVIHIAPKKPKFMNTPSKLLSSFTTSPGVQRNLASTFNKLDLSLNNSTAEANLSASNLFSFTLLDGAHSTKIRSPEKNTVPQQTKLSFNTPKSTDVQIKPVVPASSAPVATNLFNLSSTGAAASSSSVFSFTASSTSVTQSKPVIFGSSDSSTQSLMFAGASKSTQPVTKFSLSPQITTSFSQPKLADGASTGPTKEIMVSKPAEVTLIKPSVQKSTAEPSSMFGGLIASTAEIKPAQSQSFSFIQPKPATINTSSSVAKPTGMFPDSSTISALSKPTTVGFGDSSTIIASKPDSVFAGPRDSIGPGFNFGSALSLGQQSTPKPKSTGTFSIGQTLSQIPSSTTTAVTVTKPVTPIATSTVTTTAIATQIVTPKPTFALAQPTTISSTPLTPASTHVVTTTASVKTESVVASAPSSSPSIFGGLGLAVNKPATPGSFFGQQASTPSTTPSGSIFGAIQTTPSAVSGSIFGTKPAQQPEKSTASIFAASTTPTVSSALSAASPTTMASSGFSFTQIATTEPTPAKSATIFGGTAATPASPTIFAAAVTSSGITTTISSTTVGAFSFLQQAANTANSTSAAAGTVPTPKITSVFSVDTTENKLTEAVTSTVSTTTAPGVTGFGVAKTTDSSSFSFGELAAAVTATTADSNKFSFGNLTVSALSPSSAPTTSATTATTTTSSNNFSFALSAAASVETTTVTTTSTSAFGGFGSSVFGKPAAAATTTTASSFMGQPICSPSSFSQSQNSGSIFGQSTGNIFAQKSSVPTTASGSIFGSQSSGGSLFGATSNPAVTAASATSIFGQTQSSPFGSPVTSTTSSTGGSIFGQSSAFGGGAATTTSGSIFGQQQQQQQPPQQSTFGNPAATSSSGSFSFTQNAGTSPGFGSSGGSIFGTKPSFGATPAPAFGQPAAFGAPSAFGGAPTGGSVFGSPAPASNTGGSSFGGGFGSPSSFGQKPAFGSPPSFGQSAFGSPPAFGSSPSFGSPQRVFGATTAPPTGGTFGSAVQENSTFANLATQPTLGFGSLVQQQPPAPQPQQPQFSGGAQFSSWR